MLTIHVSTQVNTMEEFQQLVQSRPIAKLLYVYTVIPMVAHAPTFPMFAFCHDSTGVTTNADCYLKIWHFLWTVRIIL